MTDDELRRAVERSIRRALVRAFTGPEMRQAIEEMWREVVGCMKP